MMAHRIWMMMRVPLDRYRLHYPGDLRGKIESQVVGPNLLREYFVILETTYDATADKTTARVAFATVDDLQ